MLNGGFDHDRIQANGPHVRHYHRGVDEPDTAAALNFGVEMARGERIGLVPSDALAASDGFVYWGSRAVEHFDRALVEVRSRNGTNEDPPAAVFCSRDRFVEIGGFVGVEDALGNGDGEPSSPITLLGETMAGHGIDGRPAHDPATSQVYFGIGATPRTLDFEYAQLVIADRELQIAKLRGSRSWRFTRPVRSVTGRLRDLTTRR